MTPRLSTKVVLVGRCVLLVLVMTFAGMDTAVRAQEGPGPPPPGFEPPPEPQGMGNPEKELAHLRKRYHLTDPQQSAVAPLIKDRDDKLKALFADAGSAPEDLFPQVEAVRRETDKKIEGILDPSQRAKFQADEAKQAARARQRTDDMGGYGPPPPPPEGGGPP